MIGFISSIFKPTDPVTSNSNQHLRYFLHLSYKGTHYHGWQRQVSAISIQETIESALTKMFKVPCKIHGCGRTDTGVHASQYFAYLDLEGEYDFDPVKRVNRILPDDIAVFEFIPVDPHANTQRDAISRTYDYYLHFYKHPYLAEWSTYYDGAELDVEAMHKAALVLTKHGDFRALCKSPDKVNHTRCRVMLAEVRLLKNIDGIQFSITANRFLKGMIRLIVNKLLKVGQGKMSVEELDTFIGKKENPSYKVLAPPQGLHLSKVVYPYLEREEKGGFLGGV